MNSWMLLDVKKLFDTLDEDTTSANVGSYQQPLGSPAAKPEKKKRDYEIAASEYEKLLRPRK